MIPRLVRPLGAAAKQKKYVSSARATVHPDDSVTPLGRKLVTRGIGLSLGNNGRKTGRTEGVLNNCCCRSGGRGILSKNSSKHLSNHLRSLDKRTGI